MCHLLHDTNIVFGGKRLLHGPKLRLKIQGQSDLIGTAPIHRPLLLWLPAQQIGLVPLYRLNSYSALPAQCYQPRFPKQLASQYSVLTQHLSQAFLFAPYYYDWRQERLDFYKPLCISVLGKGMPRFLIGKYSINRFLFFLPLLLWSLAKSFLKPPISCVNTPLMQKKNQHPKKGAGFQWYSLVIDYRVCHFGLTPFRLDSKSSR